MAHDARYESWLTRHKVSWEWLPSLSLASINIRKSLDNQARLGVPLDPDRVAQYAEEMRKGASFPPIIVYRSADKYIIITGNHRVAAAIAAKRTTIEAYYVPEAESDVYLRDLLTRTANVIEGVTISFEERYQQAMYMVKMYNKSMNEVAAHMGVAASTLSLKMRSRDVADRAVSMGLQGHALPENTRMLFSPIQNDNVFKEVYEAVRTLGMNQREANDLIRETTLRGTEAEQIQKIHEIATRPEMKERARAIGDSGHVTDLKARRRLMLSLGNLRSTLARYTDPMQFQLTTKQQLDAAEDVWKSIELRMPRVLGESRRRLEGKDGKAS